MSCVDARCMSSACSLTVQNWTCCSKAFHVFANFCLIYRTFPVVSVYTHTGLFEMNVGVLTTCLTQYTRDSSICIFLFNRTTLQVFVTHLTGALYVHTLWFYKHQHPPPPASIPELKVRIRTAIETVTADMLQTVWNVLDDRVDVCRITKGAHPQSTCKVCNKKLECCSIK